MNKKYRALLGNTFIFALGNIGSRLISFLLVPLYTNVLTPDEYGTADLVLTASNLIIPIVSLVIQDSVLRFGLSKDADHGSILKNAMLVFAGGTVLTCAITPLIGLYDSLAEWKYYLISLVITNSASMILLTYTKAKEKNLLYSVASIVNTGVITLTNVLFLVIIPLGVKGYLYANIAANIVTALVCLFCSNAIGDAKGSKFDPKLFKAMLMYSIPLIANNLSWWILNSSNRVLIERYLSASELGLYTAGSKLPGLISIISTIFTQAWTISSAKEYEGERDYSFYVNIFKYFSLSLFLGASAVMLAAKDFMGIYVGEEYASSWLFVPLLLFGMVFFSFSSFFGTLYGTVKKNVSVAVTTIVSAIVNIALCIILIPTIGTMGAVIATAGSYFTIGIYRMFDSRRYIAFDIDWKLFLINTATVLFQAVMLSLDRYIYITSAICLGLLIIFNFKDIRGICGRIRSMVSKKGAK